jgi:hypothetical protein
MRRAGDAPSPAVVRRRESQHLAGLWDAIHLIQPVWWITQLKGLRVMEQVKGLEALKPEHQALVTGVLAKAEAAHGEKAQRLAGWQGILDVADTLIDGGAPAAELKAFVAFTREHLTELLG